MVFNYSDEGAKQTTLNKKKMKTIKELRGLMDFRDACIQAFDYVSMFDNIVDCLKTAPLEYKLWVLHRDPSFLVGLEDVIGIDEFSTYDWRRLLSTQPQLAYLCDKFDEFSANDWQYLLAAQPQLAHLCDKFDEFSTYDWRRLLAAQPQLNRYRLSISTDEINTPSPLYL